MAEFPLLIFPTPKIAGREKSKPGFGVPNYHLPSRQKQKDKLTPKFESMIDSFITYSTEGIEPEYVLVLETIGKIEEFERAVNAIPGLEWLAEIDSEEIEADEDFFEIPKIGKRLFYNQLEEITAKQSSSIWSALYEFRFIDDNGFITGKEINGFIKYLPEDLNQFYDIIIKVINDTIAAAKKKRISGRLFLSMSNRQAAEQLLSEWKKHCNNQEVSSKKWAEIFTYLKEIRRWDINDRIRETGVLKYWKEELQIKTEYERKIPFEIELWYRKDASKRTEIQENLENLIIAENGSIITTCTINEICFHAIKAEVPPQTIKRFFKSEYTRLFLSDDVMHFRPTGQCVSDVYPDGEESEDIEEYVVNGDPVIALLDGDPFAHHSLLENRLIIDDPDDFGSSYQANGRKHGTAMASLICHGELDQKELPLPRPIYIRPIMKPNPTDFIHNPPEEYVPIEYFFEDLILRSVRRIFEGENGEEPVAPNIKIINISVCNPSKLFYNQMSSEAKILDWLSEKHNVLFCVSAGNIKDNFNFDKPETELRQLNDENLTKLTMEMIHRDNRNRRLISPAESINALSIGAIHTDASNISNLGSRIDLLPNHELPSPISAHGHGYRQSIKPEIYIPGGRQLYKYEENQFKINDSGMAPGQKVATAPVGVGERNRSVYIRGTSNSSALATRSAGLIFESLNSLRNEIDISDEHIPVLIKALLVHGACWGDCYKILEDCLKKPNNSQNFRRIAAKYLGYGMPDIRRSIECTMQRVTALGYGKIKKDDKHEFRFPLPPSLSGLNDKRRLIITLAWFSPINAGNRKYRKANLSINPPEDEIGVKRVNAQWQQVKNGSIQHEVLEGDEVVSYQDGDFLTINVICREDSGILNESVKYGLAVTLEVAEELDIPIYKEIKQRIGIEIEIDEIT